MSQSIRYTKILSDALFPYTSRSTATSWAFVSSRGCLVTLHTISSKSENVTLSPAYTQCGKAGITTIHSYTANSYFSWKKWLQDDIGEGFFWMLYSRQTCLLALCSSLCSWCLLLVWLTSLLCANKNNGDKFYCRKSMQSVNMKQIGALLHS